MQRALLQYFNPKNKETVVKALVIAGREDLIGTGKNCLVTPPPGFKAQRNGSKNSKGGTKKAVKGKPNSRKKALNKKGSSIKKGRT